MNQWKIKLNDQMGKSISWFEICFVGRFSFLFLSSLCGLLMTLPSIFWREVQSILELLYFCSFYPLWFPNIISFGKRKIYQKNIPEKNNYCNKQKATCQTRSFSDHKSREPKINSNLDYWPKKIYFFHNFWKNWSTSLSLFQEYNLVMRILP